MDGVVENPYGGYEGPDSMYVKLISSDGHEFVVKKEHAFLSATIKAMLSGPGEVAEDEVNEVNLKEIPSHILSQVCKFFYYKKRYSNTVGDAPEAPDFDIKKEVALDLLMASNFLDC